MLDDEFAVRGIHRRGDGIVIDRRKNGGQADKHEQTRRQQQGFLAAAGDDIALDSANFGKMRPFHLFFGRGQLDRFDGLRQLDAIAAGGQDQRA